MSKEVNVKWLTNKVYIPKLGNYSKGSIKPMPKSLAEEFAKSGACEIVGNDIKTTKEVK